MKLVVDPISMDLLDHYFPPEQDEEVIESTPSNGNGRWQPKKWSPKYEEVVLMDLAGLKGYEIAERTGFTKQHVYNILATDQATSIQQAMVSRIRKESFDIAAELKKIQELTVKRLRASLEDDDTFKTSRLGFIGKGIDVMRGLGEHLKHSPSTVVNQQFAIPPSIADRFIRGLEKADEARRLRSGTEVAVVESE